MKIFITGGTGFIGRYVVRRLLQARHKVFLLVRDLKRAEEIFGRTRRLELMRGELKDLAKLEQKIKRLKPEACVHLAWEGIPDYGVEMSLKNLQYGLDLIRTLTRVGCRKMIVSGSCWEYGATSGEVSEEAKLNPRNPFAAAKVALYFLGRVIVEANKADFVWLRFFYVYGPGQKKASLIPYLLQRKERGLLPHLENRRGGNDFVYVDDVAQAVAQALFLRRGGVYNIGSGKVAGVAEIANLVYGKKIIRTARPKGFYADISRARKILGWRPKTSIKAGVLQTLRKQVLGY